MTVLCGKNGYKARVQRVETERTKEKSAGLS